MSTHSIDAPLLFIFQIMRTKLKLAGQSGRQLHVAFVCSFVSWKP